MPKEKRKLITNEEGQVVGFKTVRGRGRPRRKSFLPAWLGGEIDLIIYQMKLL